MHVALWFDFSCPYAYLASQRIEELVREAGATLSWEPMLLGGVFRATGAGAGPMATLGPAKAANNHRDMHRWAERFGVELHVPKAHPMRTVRALRVLLGLPQSAWRDAIHALYATYWVRGEDLTQDDVIEGALKRASLPPFLREMAFARADTEEIKQELFARTERAVSLGIFGAPAMVVTRDAGEPILLWGQDRLEMLKEVLRGWDPDRDALARPMPVPAVTTPIDFWFDLSSPFAYLGATQIARWPNVTWRPLLLGGLFREIGTPDVPMFAMCEAKRKYTGLDMSRWARWWGVDFKFPSKFPLRTVTAQRMIVSAAPADRPELAMKLFRAAWAEDRDIGDDAVLAAIDPALAARAKEPAAKQALIDETNAARAAGVFGVPGFVVGGSLFWGQDRLELVAAAAGGWRPQIG
ncbi:MAG TPA: 2-hydroxychromene-2-carboxylate isomerase [Kofleriaceae bacterium]|nr:2-hydroxychromene-2-carboxylate isomerase [Kofleriaceae bacterium]